MIALYIILSRDYMVSREIYSEDANDIVGKYSRDAKTILVALCFIFATCHARPFFIFETVSRWLSY